MGPDATRMASVKGLKAESGDKENIISDVENAVMRVFFFSFASINATSSQFGCRFIQKSKIPFTNDPFS